MGGCNGKKRGVNPLKKEKQEKKSLTYSKAGTKAGYLAFTEWAETSDIKAKAYN